MYQQLRKLSLLVALSAFASFTTPAIADDVGSKDGGRKGSDSRDVGHAPGDKGKQDSGKTGTQDSGGKTGTTDS